jgi:acyl-CoA synthetase (AMP-forming)/AMP-acid ligase II
MQGYHKRDDENKAAFTEDGGFRTGDLGYLDAEGFLYITGRLKEQYKLENGKYVAPAPLEEKLKLSPFIANCDGLRRQPPLQRRAGRARPKLKRRVAMKRYGEKIDALYAEDAKKEAGASAEA